MKRATGAPVVVLYSDSMLYPEAAKAAVMAVMVVMVVGEDGVVPDTVELDPDEVLLESAHPTKLGMETLTLLHSSVSNASASARC